MKVLAVIPARYASTRLPGKPLADICGKSMLQRVWEAAANAKHIDEVVIATDDRIVLEAAKAFGAKAILTSPTCLSGTDRVREVMAQIPADLYINVQGDEPMLESADLDALALKMSGNPEIRVGTLYAPITPEEANDVNLVKVVFDHLGRALYFSRSMIPFPRDKEKADYCGHIGVYAYQPDVLRSFSTMASSALEGAEKLEQLRLLQEGIPIYGVPASKMTRGVDTADDLEKVRQFFANKKSKVSFSNIRLIITDVDGVLTDGGLYYGDHGETIKKFNVKDGLGVRLARDAGLEIAVLSNRACDALSSRLQDLGISNYETGAIDKADAFEKLLNKMGISGSQTLYIGDDMPDLAPFSLCGISVAPADAAEEVKAKADIITQKSGGHGVLREIVDRILAERQEPQQ